jgi:hypothetical protein
MTDTSSAIATAKSALSSVEDKIKSVEGAVVSNPRWASSRLWVLIAALIALVLLHRFGTDKEVLAYLFVLVAIFIITRSITDLGRDWFETSRRNTLNRCNADIEIARIQKGFDDGAPLAPGTVSAKTPTSPVPTPAPGTPGGGPSK